MNEDLDQGTAPFWSVLEDSLLASLGTSLAGLSDQEAASRLEGHADARAASPAGTLRLLFRQFESPIVLILIAASFVALVMRDVPDASIILVIVLASGLLGFWQERSASNAVAALLAQVAVTVEVRREERVLSVPLDQVVPGDIVLLNAGDVVPGDGRVLTADSLLVDEAALTGESFPVEKSPGMQSADSMVAERTNSVFMGSHVVSGKGIVAIAQIGSQTELGGVSTALERKADPTSFEVGISRLGRLLARATVVLVVAIFVINIVLQRPLVDSLLFSIALAVGLTPQLLPAIIAISLATGARFLAKEQVIVKRLDAIEDFGAMTILCTDKTGTITSGSVSLSAAIDLSGADSDDVARLAWINAHFQSGYTNPLDQAILASITSAVTNVELLDEVPYDFSRKRLSVLVQTGDETLLITKGALESVLAICSTVDSGSGRRKLEELRPDIDARFNHLSHSGYRVLGVATQNMAGTTCTVSDEKEMTFRGFLAFADPVKAGAAEAIAELASLGISVRMITGDNPLAARHAASAVGLETATVVTGSDIRSVPDDQLEEIIRHCSVFAEIGPLEKERLVRGFRGGGAVVGFLGDGINDAPSLHAADVGISADSAVDVAKQEAAIVLLDKELSVIADGVKLGRQTFTNTLKYIFVATSSNFGNMLSLAAAAAFLPFLPLLPRQILLLNFIGDIPGAAIARDRVDPEQVERPLRWDVPAIRRFMLIFGAISSIFDLLTFVVLRVGFSAGAGLFRSSWFALSVVSEVMVILVLRTRRPFFQSRPSIGLIVAIIAVSIVGLALPYSPWAEALDLQAVPLRIIGVLALIIALYVIAAESVKRIIFRARSGQRSPEAELPAGKLGGGVTPS